MFTLILFVSLLCALGVSTTKDRYDNHHLYRIEVESSKHEKFIEEIKNYGFIDHHDQWVNELHVENVE